MKVFDLSQIQKSMDLDGDLRALIAGQKQAFMDFSSGCYEVPLPMQLNFPEYKGDCHIKAGFKKGGGVFVIKVASGFYENAALGLPTSDGVVLVFSQTTGALLAILSDRGWLTTLRTAIAALIAAEVTPWDIKNIGIIGTGALACLLQRLIKKQYPDANFRLYGRDLKKAQNIAITGVEVCASPSSLIRASDLVVSTTAATKAIIQDADILGKKHIIALGADAPSKQECDPVLFEKADVVMVDSKAQAPRFGDTFHAIQGGFIGVDQVLELGAVLQEPLLVGANFLITDLTGIGPQDVEIAEFVTHRLISGLSPA